MKILLALTDRDLLTGLSRFLALTGHEAVPVFDGTQVPEKLAAEKPDAAVIDRTLPRAPLSSLLTRLRLAGVPAVETSDRPVTARDRVSGQAASFLAYPFSPGELLDRLERVAKTASSGETFFVGDVAVDAGRFLLGNKIPLTVEEIDLLRALANGEKAIFPQSALLSSLNEKFRSLGGAVRIGRVAGGYGVMKHE
ncbi:MAG: response regulator transcription factor [Clostridia bacterium]|nr:response regulator transcription factor [Clostridia bacterium]